MRNVKLLKTVHLYVEINTSIWKQRNNVKKKEMTFSNSTFWSLLLFNIVGVVLKEKNSMFCHRKYCLTVPYQTVWEEIKWKVGMPVSYYLLCVYFMAYIVMCMSQRMLNYAKHWTWTYCSEYCIIIEDWKLLCLHI